MERGNRIEGILTHFERQYQFERYRLFVIAPLKMSSFKNSKVLLSSATVRVGRISFPSSSIRAFIPYLFSRFFFVPSAFLVNVEIFPVIDNILIKRLVLTFPIFLIWAVSTSKLSFLPKESISPLVASVTKSIREKI